MFTRNVLIQLTLDIRESFFQEHKNLLQPFEANWKWFIVDSRRRASIYRPKRMRCLISYQWTFIFGAKCFQYLSSRSANKQSFVWFYHQSRMPFSKTPFSNIITPLRRHQGKGFEFSPIKQSGVHHLFFSRGFRACLMLLRMLDINASIKQVDLGAGQQHDEDFLKLNPRHRIPILVDWWFYRDRIEGNHGVSCECEKARESALSSELKGLYFDATVLFEQNAIAIVSGGSENVECDNWNSRCLF